MRGQVLVVAKHRFLGDTMVTLPLVQHLASVSRAQDAPLPSLVTGAGPAVLLENHPDVGKLWTISRDASAQSVGTTANLPSTPKCDKRQS